MPWNLFTYFHLEYGQTIFEFIEFHNVLINAIIYTGVISIKNCKLFTLSWCSNTLAFNSSLWTLNSCSLFFNSFSNSDKETKLIKSHQSKIHLTLKNYFQKSWKGSSIGTKNFKKTKFWVEKQMPRIVKSSRKFV